MRISETPLLLSVLVALLVLIASSAGLFLNSLYARETMSWAVQTFGRTSEIMCLSVIFNEMIVRWRNLCSRFLRSIMQHQMSHGSDTVFE